MSTVSVVIPTRNRQAYLTETLALLSEQSYPASRTEVVVVDDGSTDGTVEALRGRRFPYQLRVESLPTSQETFWAARPRNAGLRAAGGDVVVFLDSDVFVGAGFVAGHVQAHRAAQGGGSRPTVAVGSIFGASFDNQQRSAHWLKPPSIAELARLVRVEQRPPSGWHEGRSGYAEAWPGLDDSPVPWLFFWTGNVSAPRATLQALGGFDEEFRGWGGEDTDLGYRLFEEGVRWTWAPDAWGVHYPHAVRPAVEEEVRRNCRYLLAKHPHPLVEAALWSLRFMEAGDAPAGTPLPTWRVSLLAQLGQARREYEQASPDRQLPRPILEEIVRCQNRPDTSGSILWLGPLPDDHELATDRLVHTPALSAGLSGLATPWGDRVFSAAVAAHYWAWLPPALLSPMIRELSRLSPTVRLVLSYSVASAPAAARATELLGAPTPVGSSSGGGQVLVWRRDRQ